MLISEYDGEVNNNTSSQEGKREQVCVLSGKSIVPAFASTYSRDSCKYLVRVFVPTLIVGFLEEKQGDIRDQCEVE